MLDPMEFFDRVAGLKREGEPFAIATVVARRAPVSAHLGDRAIVFADGRMDGFIGGACSREIVRVQALDAIRQGTARLVSIRPDADEVSSAVPERVVVPMSCASEGAVDVFVEPVLRPRSLVVVGATPVADAVARLGTAMRFAVVRVVADGERRDVEGAGPGSTVVTLDGLPDVLAAAGSGAAVVVASQGHYDDSALETILHASPAYVGLVASRKRGQTVRDGLTRAGAPGVERLRNPAGLDLGARMPDDVAISILAEIVRQGSLHGSGDAAGTVSAGAAVGHGSGHATPAPAVASTPEPGIAIDPVCQMEVAVNGALHTAEIGGTRYYFCCGGCRTRFVKDPQRYLAATP